MCILILFLFVGAYYYLHKPVSPEQASVIIAEVLDVALAAAATMAAVGLGPRLPWLPGKMDWTKMVQAGAAGFGGLGLLWLLLGAAGFFQSWIAWLVLLLLGIAGGYSLRTARVPWRKLWGTMRPDSPLAKALASCLGLIAAVSLLEAVAAPVHFDALVYHLALPTRYVQAGRFMAVPDNLFWSQPQLAEMLYTWMTLLRTATTAATLGWMVAAGTVIGTIGLAAERLSKTAAWVSGAALLAGYSLWSLMGAAYVDWFTAMFGLAMVAVILAEWSSRPNGRARMAGLMAGMAIGVKWTAGTAALAIAVEEFSQRRSLRDTVLFLLTVSAAVLPWLLKNMIAGGAPFFPFFLGGVDPVRLAFFQQPPMANSFWLAPVLPAAATILGVEGAPGFATSIGPLLLGLLPAALLMRRNEGSQLQGVWVFLLVGWLVWALASLTSVILAQSRLYFVLFPAWAILAGAGFKVLQEISWEGVRFGRLAGALVLLVIGMTVLSAFTNLASGGLLQRDVGLESEDGYLSRRLGAYYTAATDVRNRFEEGQVMTLWEPRSLYCLPV
ncbi:MAG: hypothetical protein WBR18_01500, partial [Anaerolineales bacterium]